jgi:TRAP-type C4-dicarboxylate transport system permease small subunit
MACQMPRTQYEKIIALRKGLFSLCSILNWIALIALLGMVLLGTAHVIGRWLFKSPILGTPEIVEYLNVILVSGAILFTHIKGGHLAIDFVISHRSKRFQGITDGITNSVSVILCALLAWTSYELASEMRRAGEVSFTLRIPFYPFIYWIALCCVLWSLLFLIDLYISVWRNK